MIFFRIIIILYLPKYLTTAMVYNLRPLSWLKVYIITLLRLEILCLYFLLGPVTLIEHHSQLPPLYHRLLCYADNLLT